MWLKLGLHTSPLVKSSPDPSVTEVAVQPDRARCICSPIRQCSGPVILGWAISQWAASSSKGTDRSPTGFVCWTGSPRAAGIILQPKSRTGVDATRLMPPNPGAVLAVTSWPTVMVPKDVFSPEKSLFNRRIRCIDRSGDRPMCMPCCGFVCRY